MLSGHLLSEATRNQLMTFSFPEWCRLLLSAAKSDMNAMRVPPEMLPDDFQRDFLRDLSRALSSITKALPGPDQDIAGAITEMLLAFPAQPMGVDVATSRSRSYLAVLSDLPAWAVAVGVGDYLRGEGGAGNENYAFSASPPQVRQLAVNRIQWARDMAGKIAALAECVPAYPARPAPRLERVETPEEIETRMKRAAFFREAAEKRRPPKAELEGQRDRC